MDTNNSFRKIIILMLFVKFIPAYTHILILPCLKVYGKGQQNCSSKFPITKKVSLMMKLHSTFELWNPLKFKISYTVMILFYMLFAA